MNFVFDCNVLVNSFIFESSIARQCWEKAETLGSVIVSDETLAEYKRVFAYEKFDKYVALETRLEFLVDIQEIVEFVAVSHAVKVCRDSMDDMYLELALSGKADCIITNDNDLLVLHPFEKIPIITPLEFLKRYS
jgi:uncharacterized protein